MPARIAGSGAYLRQQMLCYHPRLLHWSRHMLRKNRASHSARVSRKRCLPPKLDSLRSAMASAWLPSNPAASTSDSNAAPSLRKLRTSRNGLKRFVVSAHCALTILQRIAPESFHFNISNALSSVSTVPRA
eukprot:1974142-Rhodomonas_salina.1